MSGRALARMTAVIALGASGTYFFVYLYRWEWNRVLVAGLVFVAAELSLGLMGMGDRLRRIEERLDGHGRAGTGTVDPAVLQHVRDSAPPSREPFRWLHPDQGQSAVFVPILLGAGVAASALAWLVERIAARTARPALERDLARRLSELAWPDEPLAGPGHELGGWLAGPLPPDTH